MEADRNLDSGTVAFLIKVFLPWCVKVLVQLVVVRTEGL